MATRFGGVVKAVLPAVDSRSFLEAKFVQTATLERTLGVAIPIALMTSFATDEAIREHVRRRRLGSPLVFNQFVSLRLDPSGELFQTPPIERRCTRPGTGTSSRHCAAPARSTPCATVASGS